ncbi:DUF6571 family protein [Streptomyces xanthochromogenes]|uniref:DUF6571 domain-containing protein n=1 Tax=Streptomyces xanthochromogenes TaxID=67384 RepID=A0ABQ2ZRT3_9ACTN|nr:DUF6571 family protein [Streptomyces xanthochromogenes]GGY21030.1 hypothetical protein GCM10010326_12220 [Streptomyces xanthochromogenes]
MLKYTDVLNAPVDKLKTAADDWSEMATRLGKLAREAHDGMRAHADRASWAGVNAVVTREFITRTAKEFDDAAKEAAGVHRVLLDGYGAFKKARDELRAIADGAETNGIVIDASGTVTARHPLQDDTAARHDPEYPKALQKQNSALEAWQQRVKAAVETCDEADEALRLALAGNVTDAHDFSAPKFAGLADEEAARAADLAKKVTGDGGTARNPEALEQLRELLDDHRGDPAFSTAFYRRMGPDGALEFYARLSLDSTGLGPAGADRVASVRHIQDDLGPMLGLATSPRTPGHLDATWTLALMRAGRKPIDVGGFAGVTTRVYGYQALGALLRHGTYDREFLLPVARDMVGFEHQHPKAFQEAMPYNAAMAFNLDKEGGRGLDPLTGLMTAMSNNPRVASEFFNEPVREDTDGNGIVTTDDRPVTVKDDEGRPSTLGMVDYMLDKSPSDDWYDTVGGTGETTPFQSAMGNALEAAVTGRTPGDTDARPVEHTAAMSHVMEQVVEKIGSDPGLMKDGEDGTPGKLSGLAGHFGNMAAEYMPDLQAISENGAHQAKPFGVLAEFNRAQVGQFLGVVAQDPGAYGAITNAQQAYTTLLVRDVFAHPENHGHDVGEAVRNAVHPGGQIAGMMAEARVEAVYEKQAADDEEFNKAVEDKSKWVNRVIDSVGGKYIELLPVGGDAVGWLKEDISERLVDEAKQNSSDKASQEAGAAYTTAETNAKQSAANAVRSAGLSAGLEERDVKEFEGTASTGIADAYAAGRSATRALTPRGGGE